MSKPTVAISMGSEADRYQLELALMVLKFVVSNAFAKLKSARRSAEMVAVRCRMTMAARFLPTTKAEG